MSIRKISITIYLLLLLATNLVHAQETGSQRLRLATTTSTEDSGLLDFILPDFEERYHIGVDVISVGTGQALALGESGDVDVLLVHAREQEEGFIRAGHGLIRYDVMFNDFVVIGPEDDPAGIRGLGDAGQAFAMIAGSGALFVSRGDRSGTHSKELQIWEEAATEPQGDWYISAGQGMGAILTMSDELQAYTLSDRATYLTRQEQGLSLDVLIEGDPLLFNPYGVIPLNPDAHPSIHADLAQAFAHWLISIPTQEQINEYQWNGHRLFTPNSVPYRVANR